MKAAVLYGKRDVRIKDVVKPTPADHEVLIQIKAVGICGSDIHYYEEFGMGNTYKMTEPQILGHEPSGVVVEVGANVKKFKPGDRVTIEPGETCGHCVACRNGHYNLCEDVRFLSVPGNKGAFAEYVVMGEEMLFSIPDNMSYEIACMAEPLSVGIHACRLIHVQPEERLLVVGAGPIGLMTIAAAKAFGMKNITVCDVQKERLETAKEICHIENGFLSTEKSPEQVREEYTDGKGYDCLIEASGAPVAQWSTISYLKKGGRMSMVGIPKEMKVGFNIFDLIDKEITVQGVFRYANDYPLAIQMLQERIIDFEKIITNRFPLQQTGEALEHALTNKKSMKVVITTE